MKPKLAALAGGSGADDGAKTPEGKASFAVVGIGASAGGLEALERFFRSVPAGSGAAYVIVQHLDPTYVGLLPELIQRTTKMPVSQVKDRMKVEPDRVYVIPPAKDMSILHGVLLLSEPSAPRGHRLPIDGFFRSLAGDQREMAIGVVLSGMGSDGTLGLRAIKDEAGLVLVQDPKSAKFDGMPRSAIEAGLADFVAPAEDLPDRLLSYLRHTPLTGMEPELSEKKESSLDRVMSLVRSRTGHDFSLYKKSTIYRRIERRMGIHQLDSIASYARYAKENALELDLLFKEILIGVTSFFRDPPEWDRLRFDILPALLASHPGGYQFRAWVPGCSTGEDAYSLAMVFREAVERSASPGRFTLQVFATDLSKDAVEAGRQGAYSPGIAGDVSAERLDRFFVKEETVYRVAREIRKMVLFAQQNVVMDPPFTKLDLLVCRNVLIYLAPELQQKLLPVFHFSLKPDGILFLGSAENADGHRELFKPVEGTHRIFRRAETGVRGSAVEYPTTFSGPAAASADAATRPRSAPSLQAAADQMLLSRFAPAAVLVNEKGDILYVSGRTGKYLEPAVGKANWNVVAMARAGLRYELDGAFQEAARQEGPVTLKGLKVVSDGGPIVVDVTVQVLDEPLALKGAILITFVDQLVPLEPPSTAPEGARGARHGTREKARDAETQRLRAELKRIREEMQASQEELMSANEEQQSANEELQSTNEELTTSREEMQSLNEELQTVNAELQSKIDDLSGVHSDMKNLLDSTEIATVFLDGALRIRRFSSQAGKLIRLIPGDAGRPFTDIASSLLYPGLADDAREVLRTLVFVEREVTSSDSRLHRIRVMPYRTLDDRIDGLVITFTDITAFRKSGA